MATPARPKPHWEVPNTATGFFTGLKLYNSLTNSKVPAFHFHMDCFCRQNLEASKKDRGSEMKSTDCTCQMGSLIEAHMAKREGFLKDESQPMNDATSPHHSTPFCLWRF